MVMVRGGLPDAGPGEKIRDDRYEFEAAGSGGVFPEAHHGDTDRNNDSHLVTPPFGEPWFLLLSISI